jgi:hypothetical protein
MSAALRSCWPGLAASSRVRSARRAVLARVKGPVRRGHRTASPQVTATLNHAAAAHPVLSGWQVVAALAVIAVTIMGTCAIRRGRSE